ncbi:hypothetical protein Pelo_14049 [Pelomyxa schiedti]|nr:hypothetical protein Pelo_14049 [Pelomyxa schiedti]
MNSTLLSDLLKTQKPGEDSFVCRRAQLRNSKNYAHQSAQVPDQRPHFQCGIPDDQNSFQSLNSPPTIPPSKPTTTSKPAPGTNADTQAHLNRPREIPIKRHLIHSHPLSIETVSVPQHTTWASLTIQPRVIISPTFQQQSTNNAFCHQLIINNEQSKGKPEDKHNRKCMNRSREAESNVTTIFSARINPRSESFLNIPWNFLISVMVIRAVVPYNRIEFADRWRNAVVQCGESRLAKKGVVEKTVITSIKMNSETQRRETTYVSVTSFPGPELASKALVTWENYMSNRVPNPPNFDFLSSGITSCIAFVPNW